MQLKFTFLIIIIFTVTTKAQIYTPGGLIQGASGNNFIGIGTNTPLHKLNVYGSHSDSRILLHSIGSGDEAGQADLMLWASEPGLTYTGVGMGNNISNYTTSNGLLKLLNPARGGSYIRLLDNSMSFNVVSSSGTDKQALNVNTLGYVSIGSESPTAPLTVYGKAHFFPARTETLDGRSLEIGNTANISPFINNNYPVVLKTGGGNQPLILDAARVGIGTTNPSSMLTVAGNIASREVKVTVDAGADFVFENDYPLPSLDSLDKFIKENKHLPEVASAKEMQKDGINLSEMNIKLLQKIEEMTLYMIDQNKQMKVLQEQIDQQNKEIQQLKCKK
ncbi:hypothetical protein [Flavobacterium chilense]|nr:hypothetical protein [Flavobacterium chilense]